MTDGVELDISRQHSGNGAHSNAQLIATSSASSTSTPDTPKPNNALASGLPSSTTASLDRRRRAPPTFHFLAGLVTGSISAILLQPADLLKTRVQQSRGASVGGALREILSQPGVVRQLWRGALPSVIRTGFGSALYFWSLNALRATWTGRQANDASGNLEGRRTEPRRGGDMKEELGKIANLARKPGMQTAQSVPGPALDGTIALHMPPSSTSYLHPSSSEATPSPSTLAHDSPPPAARKPSNAVNLVTGALARGGAGLIMMPVTVLKVRYESSLYNSYGSSVSLVGATSTIFAREGLRGLYAGYGATLVRDAPHAGLYVLFYEQAKSAFSQLSQPTSTDFAVLTATKANTVNFASGIVAAAAATAVTNPFDAIKTRIQLMPERYRNMPQAAATILREEGPRAMLDGLGLRMARKAMSSALAWTIYEDLVRRAETRYEAVSMPNAT